MLIENSINVISAILVGAFVARFLGPEQFGIYSVVIAINAVALTLTKLGLDNIVARDLAHKNFSYNSIISSTIFLRIISGAFVYTTTLLILSILNYRHLNLVAIASAPVIISFSDIVFSIYQNKLKLDTLSKLKITQIALVSIIRIIAISYEMTLMQFVWILLLDQLILYVGYLGLLWFSRNLIGKLDFLYLKRLLRDALPLVMIAFSTTLFMRMDQFMIDVLTGSKETGIYSAAIKIAEGPIFLVLIISNVMMPTFSILFKENRADFENAMKKWMKVIIRLSIGIAVLLILCAEFVIYFLYGPEYEESIIILRYYAIVIVFLFVNNFSWIWIINHNLHIVALFKLIIGLIINGVLNYFMIKMYGIRGAVVATLITYVFVTLLLNFAFKRLRPLLRLVIDSGRALLSND